MSAEDRDRGRDKAVHIFPCEFGECVFVRLFGRRVFYDKRLGAEIEGGALGEVKLGDIRVALFEEDCVSGMMRCISLQMLKGLVLLDVTFSLSV